MGTIQLGNVPAWLGLVGGLVAAAAYVSSRADVRRTAASAVYVVLPKYRFSGPQPDEDDFTDYKVVNAGALPAYDIGVAAYEFGKRRWFWRFREFHNWMTGAIIETRVHHTLEPGSDVGGKMRAVSTTRGQRFDADAPPVLILFRDGNGRRWVRWPLGKLNRVRYVRFKKLT